MGFSLRWLPLQHVGSSRTRAWTCVPCIGRWILNHCATREVLGCSSWFSLWSIPIPSLEPSSNSVCFIKFLIPHIKITALPLQTFQCLPSHTVPLNVALFCTDFLFCLSCKILKGRESCLSHLALLQRLAQCLPGQHQRLRNTIQNAHKLDLQTWGPQTNTWMGFHHLISECLLPEESYSYFSHSPQLLPFFLWLCLGENPFS